MRSFKVFLLTLLYALTVLGCDVPQAHYKTMKCKPVGSRSNGCPQRYDCPSITSYNSSKCYFHGKTYEVDQQVPDEEIGLVCPNCYCGSENSEANFICAHGGCSEHTMPSFYRNCVLQYKPNSCCASGAVCGEKRNRLATCKLGNEIYRTGQRMHFKNNRCRTCICTASFNANAIETNPNCVETVCDFELVEAKQVYGGGIPVYKKDDCCPWEWRMPKPTDSVEKRAGRPATAPKMQCKYGSLTLNVGDSLKMQQQQGPKMSCSCQVPPLMHCLLD